MISRSASCPVATFSLLSIAREGPPAPATSAMPLFAITPSTHAATRAVTSTVTNVFALAEAMEADPSSCPSPGVDENVTPFSSQAPVTRRTSSVPGAVTLLIHSRSVARAMSFPVEPGGSIERSNLSSAVEAGL